MKDTKTNCSDVLDKLPLFVGGDLESDAITFVRAHLAQCESCEREAALAARSRDAFRTALRASLAHSNQLAESDSPFAQASRAREDQVGGLWSGIRSTLVAEGLLTNGVGASTEPNVELAPTTARPRLVLLKRVGSIAAAAAVLAMGLVFGPGLLDGDATRDEFSNGSPVANVVDDIVTSPVNTLAVNERKLQPRFDTDEALSDQARLLRVQPMAPSGVAGENSVASSSAGFARPVR